MSLAFRNFIYVLLLIILSVQHLFAQDDLCKCGLEDEIKPKVNVAIEKSDTVTTKTLLKALSTKNEEPCKILYYELAIKNSLINNRANLTENYIQLVQPHLKKACQSQQLQIYKLIANYYTSQANYKKLIEYDLKILSIVEKQGNKFEEANCLLNISQTFNRLNSLEKSISYTRRAKSIVQLLPDSASKIKLLGKLTSRYLWYGQDFKKSSYLDTSQKFATHTIELAKKFNEVKPQLSAFVSLNAIAQERKQFRLAASYLDKAQNLCTAQDINALATIFTDKANLFMLMKDYKTAKKYADSGLHYHQLLNYKPLIANAYATLYQIELKNENYHSALAAYKKEREITDSLNKTENVKQVTELEQRYGKARNEIIIKDLSNEKKIKNLQLKFLSATLIIAIIIIALIIVWYRQRVLRNKQELLATESRLNRLRINPHFFFNTLTSLQGMALKEDDRKKLASHLFLYSRMMRQTLESSYDELITIEKEIDFIKEYLELHLLNDPEKFDFEINSTSVSTDELLIPTMLLQPFVENAIEHGFADMHNNKGNISITFQNAYNQLIVRINDNGKGIDTIKENKKEYQSRALQITRDRLFLLNYKRKSNARFIVQNAANEQGTEIILYLPLIISDTFLN